LVVAAVHIDADVPAARVPRVLVGVELHGNNLASPDALNFPVVVLLVLVKETQADVVRAA
jgi:hypothetical protein